jgi:hypothetical protein
MRQLDCTRFAGKGERFDERTDEKIRRRRRGGDSDIDSKPDADSDGNVGMVSTAQSGADVTRVG